MRSPTPAERMEYAKTVKRLGCVEVTQRCKAFDAPSPYAWFWQDGSESGVITVRQDYEHHKATFSRMTFQPVYAIPETFQDERDELREILKDLVDLESEAWAVGGGPGYAERKKKAWTRANELFEP